MEETRFDSILALDIGATYTKAALFDRVEGQRRFVASGQAPTTTSHRDADASRAALAAVQYLQEVVGRPLVGHERPIVPERSSGEGVDACFIVSSIASPLRALLLATSAPAAADLAAKVSLIPDLAIAETINIAPEVSESRMARLLQALRAALPDVIAVAGEGKAGLVELAQCLSITARVNGSAPPVIFIGNEDCLGALRRGLPDDEPLYHIPSDCAPAEVLASLGDIAEALWRRAWQGALPRSERLAAWTNIAPCSIRHGFADALRFLAAHRKTDVWGLDIGASATSVIGAVDGALELRGRADLGIGRGSLTMMGEITRVGQWLAYGRGDGALAESVLNRTFHPFVLPETPADRLLQGALAREAGRQVCQGLAVRGGLSPTLLVGRGAPFSAAASPGEAALLLLDALQPVGCVELAIDPLGILPALGAMARSLPEAASELLLRDGLKTLGPCLALAGTAREDSVAAKVTIERALQKQTAEVSFGGITALPLNDGETVKVTVSPSGKLDCGAGPGRKVTHCFKGGPLGVIIDARGRPFDGQQWGERRLERLAAWREAMSA